MVSHKSKQPQCAAVFVSDNQPLRANTNSSKSESQISNEVIEVDTTSDQCCSIVP